MTDSDDLFEFGDLEEDDSLEIDLDDLFGDLESLALDVDAIEAGDVATPVQAQAVPTPGPSAPATEAAQAPTPVAAPQPISPSQVIQPIAPGQPVYVQPAPAVEGATGKLRLTKTNAAIAFATIITLANVAVTMIKPAASPGPQVNQIAMGEQQAEAEDFQYRESQLKAQVDSLEAQVQRLGTPAKPVPSSYTNGDHPAFADVNDYFQAGLYPAGRQRLYNLLAIVDNFQPNERDAIESKASYMLADSWRMEAELLALKESTND